MEINVSKVSSTLKLEQALQRMRTGACLTHMQAKGPYHWFVVPGGAVTDTVASKILEHPSVVGGKDGLFPQHDQTWRMLSFAS
jgi:hypothetical protein